MDKDEETELPVSARSAPSDKLSPLDYLIAGVLALGVIALLLIWPFPGIYPDAWQDVAIAAGLRPIAEVCPGLWHLLSSWLFKTFGFGVALSTLKLAGPIAIGFCAGLAYLLLREILSLTSRLRLQYSPQRFLIVRMASTLGALFFACADPVWRAGQIFTPVTFLLVLTVVGLYLFFSFLQGGLLISAYGAMLVLGALSAESPLGILLVAFCWGVYFLAVRHVLSLDMPLLNPFIEQISKWHMTFLFAFGFLSVIALNCLGFGWLD